MIPRYLEARIPVPPSPHPRIVGILYSTALASARRLSSFASSVVCSLLLSYLIGIRYFPNPPLSAPSSPLQSRMSAAFVPLYLRVVLAFPVNLVVGYPIEHVTYTSGELSILWSGGVLKLWVRRATRKQRALRMFPVLLSQRGVTSINSQICKARVTMLSTLLETTFPSAPTLPQAPRTSSARSPHPSTQ